MPQPKKSYQELRVPFQKMSFSPDVPSAALGPNEYNSGKNVETDVRGLRSAAGDILAPIGFEGTPTFISGGYRQRMGEDPRDFYFIVATESGKWWATNGGFYQEITPIGLSTTYTQDQNITEAWSGTVPIFNDEAHAPMFWPEDSTRHSVKVASMTFVGPTSTRLNFAVTQGSILWSAGDIIQIYGIDGLNETRTVQSCTTTSVTVGGFGMPSGATPYGYVADPLPRMKMYSNQQPIGIHLITAVDTNTRNLSFKGICDTSGSSISGTVLTVGTMVEPSSTGLEAFMAPGMYIVGAGVAAGTRIVENISGQGAGSTWRVNISQTVGPVAMKGYPWASAPFQAGEYITLTDVSPRYYDGTWLVESCTIDSMNITCTVDTYHDINTGTINPEYSWNYNPNWSSVYAKFLRIYNTPNVGSILVAGNLTATNQATGELEYYPVTVQWSQAFGLNQVPTTWTPTTTNIANQLEVPLRGAALDAFPCNGNFFVSSYWDTVVFSPLNYSTTNTPILGVRLFNQGRGLLNPNCWANTDQKVYGLDARDVWVFDGTSFQGLGNQRVKNWLFDKIDPRYYSRIFLEVNTRKNQVEIFYPDVNATNGVPNWMISYRFDLDCWNAPRQVDGATFSCESPYWRKIHNDSLNPRYTQWEFDPASRHVVYARGFNNYEPLIKDNDYSFLTGVNNNITDIEAVFRKDNIKLLEDYSGKLLTHRILPEVVNLDNGDLEIDPVVTPGLVGSVNIRLEGANSVGQPPVQTTNIVVNTDTDEPWAQIGQNAHRVNSLEVNNTSATDIWMLTAITFQITQTEDDR